MLVLGAGVQDVASFAAAEPNVSARTQLLATRRLHLPTRALMHAGGASGGGRGRLPSSTWCRPGQP